MPMSETERKMAGLPPGPRRMTRGELAEHWGVTKQAVSKMFRKAGAPRFAGDNRIRVDVAEAWREGGQVIQASDDGAPAADAPLALSPDMSVTELRKRQEFYKARLLQSEVKEADGSLVTRSEVVKVAREDGAAIRSALMSMPASIAPEVADAAVSGGSAAVATVLLRWARETLSNFSRGFSGTEMRSAIGGD